MSTEVHPDTGMFCEPAAKTASRCFVSHLNAQLRSVVHGEDTGGDGLACLPERCKPGWVLSRLLNRFHSLLANLLRLRTIASSA